MTAEGLGEPAVGSDAPAPTPTPPVRHDTPVPPPPSSRRLARPMASPATAGHRLPAPPRASPLLVGEPRRIRPRRSVVGAPTRTEAAEVPDDAAGRVAIFASDPTTPRPTLVASAGEAPVSVAVPVPDAASASGQATPAAARTTWIVVAALAALLVVVFVVGMRLTA